MAGLQAATTASPPPPRKDNDKTAAQAFAQAPASNEQAAQAQATAPVAAAPAVAGRPGTVASTAQPVHPVQSPATAGSIGGALFALVLVVGLILALGWLAKRLPGFRGAAGHHALRVVSSLSLSPRERVVVVAVGETQLLLGVGAGGIRTLHTLEQPLPVAAPAATPAFAQLLAQHFGKKA
jgi:flagellar protein FliO/FliZ